MPIPFHVTERDGVARNCWPITGGLALPRGFAGAQARFAVHDAEGYEVPSQIEVMRTWDDGSARWVLIDMQQAFAEHEHKAFTLEAHDSSEADTVGAGDVSPRGVVEGEPLPCLDGARSIRASRVHVVDSEGRTWSRREPGRTVVERSGRLHTVVRTSGRVISPNGERFVRWEARTSFYKDLPWTRTQFTYIIDGKADPLVLRELAVVADVAGEGESRMQLAGGLAWTPNVKPTLTDAPATIVQHDSANSHIEADDGAPLVDQTVKSRGYVGVEAADGETGIGIVLADMWQSAPKALRAAPDGITVAIWPKQAREPFGTSPGLARTHTLYVMPYAAGSDIDDHACGLAAPIMPSMSIDQWNATGVLPPMLARDDTSIPMIEQLTWRMHSGYSLFTNERNIGVWGLGELNWGDFVADSYNKRGLDQTYGKGMVWGNGEAQVGYGMLLQHLRTGQIEYLQQGLACARHKADVDTIHDHDDAGLIGGQHLHTAGHTLGNPTWCHMWTNEIALAYLLTGDTRLRDVLSSTGEYLLRTAAAADLARFKMRNGGWLLMCLCACYEALGDARYLEQGRRVTQGIREWIGKGAPMWLPPRMHVHTPVHTFIALTGVADYLRQTGDDLARDTLLEGGQLVLDRGRDEGGFFFVADGQAYRQAGRWPACHSLIVMATLYDITGDRQWLEVGMHQCRFMLKLMEADTRFGPEENWAQGGIYLTWAFAFYHKAHEAGVLRDIA